MQIRRPDLVLSAAGNREVRGAQQFAHLLGQAKFPEVLGRVRLGRIDRLAPFVGEKISGSVRRELAPSFYIHPFEHLYSPDHRPGGTGTGKFKRAEQIGQKLAEKRVMLVE